MATQIVISRIQNRRGLRENLPQPLNPGEFALTADTKQVWVGGDPLHTVSGIAVYSDKDIATAQSIVDTAIVEIRFDTTYSTTLFNSLKVAIVNSNAITISDDQIEFDATLRVNPPNSFQGYSVYVTADQGVDPANTIANLQTVVQSTSSAGALLSVNYLGNQAPFGGDFDTSGFMVLDNHKQATILARLINNMYAVSPSINGSPTGLVHTNLNIEIGTRIVGEDVGGGGVIQNTNVVETFTGDGLTSTFVLLTPNVATTQPYVSINGLTQIPVEHYNISGFDITFDEPPPNNSEILVMIPRSFLI